MVLNCLGDAWLTLEHPTSASSHPACNCNPLVLIGDNNYGENIILSKIIPLGSSELLVTSRIQELQLKRKMWLNRLNSGVSLTRLPFFIGKLRH